MKGLKCPSKYNINAVRHYGMVVSFVGGCQKAILNSHLVFKGLYDLTKSLESLEGERIAQIIQQTASYDKTLQKLLAHLAETMITLRF